MPKKLTTKGFIGKAKLVHGNTYDYSQVNYILSNKKVKIVCKRHGSFEQTPQKHLQNRGCPVCADTTLTTENFIMRANLIHGNKYDYSKTIYINRNNKIKIVCKLHGEFGQIANNHLLGKGCPDCKNEKLSLTKRKPLHKCIKEFKEIHGDRYDYTDTKYTMYSKTIPIKCKIHGTFIQKIYNHLCGHGCPKCHHRISGPEVEFLNYANVDEANRQLKINKKLVDGYDSKTNTIYEFLGDFWHGNPIKFKDNDIHPYMKQSYKHIRNKTFEKLNYLKSLGYIVKYIWECDWKQFKKGLVGVPKIVTL